MAREQAIAFLKKKRNKAHPYDVEYYDMAIQALSQEPCDDTVSRGVFEQIMWERNVAIEQLKELGYELGQKIDLCEDVISREAAIKALLEHEDAKGYLHGDFEEIINELPSVTSGRHKGRWIDYSEDGFVECPFCGHATTCEDDIDELHYCFYCGAEMVEPQESEVNNG